MLLFDDDKFAQIKPRELFDVTFWHNVRLKDMMSGKDVAFTAKFILSGDLKMP